MTAYWCPTAWLPQGPTARVRLVVAGPVITVVQPGVDPAPDDVVLPGVVLPGLANAHSHAFHRALRGRTTGQGDFWTWRAQMYAVASVLTPDSYFELARAVYAEMVLAGVTAVGEFHYLHHGAGGVRYDDPNAMGEALRAAARDAGLRLTLLDTCYLTAGIGRQTSGVQLRFDDGDGAAWAERVTALRPDAGFRVGAGVHSVRAVPRRQIALVADWARAQGVPCHTHLSEQPAENDACQAGYGLTPTQVLAEAGALGGLSTVVHAVHLTPGDIAAIGASGTTSCLCPTTERDLGDGIAPAAALRAMGSPLCLGSDQQATTDLLAKAHALEMHERLTSGRRGVFDPMDLMAALTTGGHRSIGWPEAGALSVGAAADLVAVRLDTVRTAGALPSQVALVAGAADVDTVIVGGEPVVQAGAHRMGDVGELLGRAIGKLRADERPCGEP